MPIDCTTNRTAEACAKANGWPAPESFYMQFGSGAPENVYTGYGAGSFYLRTSNQKLYVFTGSHGGKTGWTILN